MQTSKELFAAPPAARPLADPQARRAAGRGCRCSGRRKHIYAQVIDDAQGTTLAAASTLDKDLQRKR